MTLGGTRVKPVKAWWSQVAETDSPTDKFVGSPSLLIDSGGTYWAAHDWFGSGTAQDTTEIYKSTDNGDTWSAVRTITGLFWAQLFEFSSDLYLLGTSTQWGNLVIFKSTDDFATAPTSTTIWTDVRYHKSPNPVIFQDSHLLTALSDREGSGANPEWHRHYLVWCADSNLMTAGNWGKTTALAYDRTWNDVSWDDVKTGWLEPNLLDVSGTLKIYSRHSNDVEHKACRVDVTWDSVTPSNSSISFNDTTGFIDIPGGGVQFHPVWDSTLSKWLILSNHFDSADFRPSTEPGENRDRLWLCSSGDMESWTREFLIHGYGYEVSAGDGAANVGWQYVSPVIDGNDLVFLSRTAWNGADTYHNANRLTFHRIKEYANFITV